MKLTDTSRMPYGKYKNEKMANVPADYLIWILDNNQASDEVIEYINENIDILKEEIELKKQSKPTGNLN